MSVDGTAFILLFICSRATHLGLSVGSTALLFSDGVLITEPQHYLHFSLFLNAMPYVYIANRFPNVLLIFDLITLVTSKTICAITNIYFMFDSKY